MASYTPDYLSDISEQFLDKKGPEDLADLQKQLRKELFHNSASTRQRWKQAIKEAHEKREAFKVFLITLYKESREQISEEFFSSSFCFFQTAKKIKISAAQKIIELKPRNTMTDEESDASKTGLLGKIMDRFTNFDLRYIRSEYGFALRNL